MQINFHTDTANISNQLAFTKTQLECGAKCTQKYDIKSGCISDKTRRNFCGIFPRRSRILHTHIVQRIVCRRALSLAKIRRFNFARLTGEECVQIRPLREFFRYAVAGNVPAPPSSVTADRSPTRHTRDYRDGNSSGRKRRSGASYSGVCEEECMSTTTARETEKSAS